MNDYNMLLHYANFRKAVVSDVPNDIYLERFAFDTNEKEYILKGLPLLRNCLLSIYESIIEYAKDPLLPRLKYSEYKSSGDIMKERRDAAMYIDKVLITLYCIISDGTYDENKTVTVSKEYLKELQLPLRVKAKFQQSHLKHYEYFSYIEYIKNGVLSDWLNCDSVHFIFKEKELCYTLRHLIKSGIEVLYFQYGDFRTYSKSGQTEDRQNRFPESVRVKALGLKKYGFYQTLCNKTRDILNIEQTGENPHQGGAFFQILCDYGDIARYKNTYKNSRIGLCIKQDILTVNLRLGFDAFGKLPEIIEKLSPNVRNGFLSMRQCQSPDCPHKCTSKRFAIFNENIYSDKVFKPCQCHVAECNIESDYDINSIILIYEHIKKYTEKLKRNNTH